MAAGARGAPEWTCSPMAARTARPPRRSSSPGRPMASPAPPPSMMATNFLAVWSRTDWPLSAGLAPPRSWVWGPAGWDTRQEPYAEAPGGQRLVSYYDKARMEITDPRADPASPWFVTNGLLVWEMIA